MDTREYGLDVTNNSKTGFAFSLPRNKTCIGATEVCKKHCYGKSIRYQSEPQKAKRERNFRTVQLLLEKGGPQLLADNLVTLIDHTKPLDWLTAKLTAGQTVLPWTFRIHDVGDFFSAEYVEAWRIAVELRPECDFWFYTRSFNSNDMIVALSKLSMLPNCQGFLSIDSENYRQFQQAYRTSSAWKVAIMQESPDMMPKEVLQVVKSVVPAGRIVNFPCHQGGRHVEPIVDSSTFLCPQVVGVYALETNKHLPKPCQQCKFCLPC
jgi:hypothetical protein